MYNCRWNAGMWEKLMILACSVHVNGNSFLNELSFIRRWDVLVSQDSIYKGHAHYPSGIGFRIHSTLQWSSVNVYSMNYFILVFNVLICRCPVDQEQDDGWNAIDFRKCFKDTILACLLIVQMTNSAIIGLRHMFFNKPWIELSWIEFV